MTASVTSAATAALTAATTRSRNSAKTTTAATRPAPISPTQRNADLLKVPVQPVAPSIRGERCVTFHAWTRVPARAWIGTEPRLIARSGFPLRWPEALRTLHAPHSAASVLPTPARHLCPVGKQRPRRSRFFRRNRRAAARPRIACAPSRPKAGDRPRCSQAVHTGAPDRRLARHFGLYYAMTVRDGLGGEPACRRSES